MSFTPVKNVRIKSLTDGAVVQLRLGKAAVKSASDEVITAKVLRHEEDSNTEKSSVVFQRTNDEGETSEFVISRFTGAPWRSEKSTGNKYVSLVAVDESTYTIVSPASPVTTEAISDAVDLVGKESDDVFAHEQLIDLLTKIQTGKRVPADIRASANRLAVKLVDELSALPEEDEQPQN